MECPNCHHEINQDDAFCSHCGQRLSLSDKADFNEDAKCSNCGHVISPSLERCPECHKKLSFMEKHNLVERLGYRDLFFACIGIGFGCIIPIIGIIMNSLAIVFGYLNHKKDEHSFEAFVLGTIGLTISITLVIFNFIQVYNNIFNR